MMDEQIRRFNPVRYIRGRYLGGGLVRRQTQDGGELFLPLDSPSVRRTAEAAMGLTKLREGRHDPTG